VHQPLRGHDGALERAVENLETQVRETGQHRGHRIGQGRTGQRRPGSLWLGVDQTDGMAPGDPNGR